ncbi:MAG: hypothetical protein H0U95_18365 [Bacteroidetes bacterium]|nr:hypothetical protein [Bacteroidota bacterium]
MKKSSIIFLCVFYLFVSSGLAMNVHFCGGKLKNISFFQDDEKGCCGSKKKSMGCCKSHSLIYKIKDKHNSVNLLKAPQVNSKLVFLIPFQLTFNIGKEDKGFTSSYLFDHPVWYDNPIYLRCRVLII